MVLSHRENKVRDHVPVVLGWWCKCYCYLRALEEIWRDILRRVLQQRCGALAKQSRKTYPPSQFTPGLSAPEGVEPETSELTWSVSSFISNIALLATSTRTGCCNAAGITLLVPKELTNRSLEEAILSSNADWEPAMCANNLKPVFSSSYAGCFCLVCWFSCSFVSEACACFWGMVARGFARRDLLLGSYVHQESI